MTSTLLPAKNIYTTLSKYFLCINANIFDNEIILIYNILTMGSYKESQTIPGRLLREQILELSAQEEIALIGSSDGICVQENQRHVKRKPGVKKGSNIATDKDIRDRMIYQYDKYLNLEETGEVPQLWAEFGRRHVVEIDRRRLARNHVKASQ